jgi:hypothetical protein
MIRPGCEATGPPATLARFDNRAVRILSNGAPGGHVTIDYHHLYIPLGKIEGALICL